MLPSPTMKMGLSSAWPLPMYASVKEVPKLPRLVMNMKVIFFIGEQPRKYAIASLGVKGMDDSKKKMIMAFSDSMSFLKYATFSLLNKGKSFEPKYLPSENAINVPMILQIQFVKTPTQKP